MNEVTKKQREYTPAQLNRLIKASQRRDSIQSYLDNLSENIFSDIIDGWTTGDPLLDFVLVSCNGVYDAYIISLQYRRLSDLGLRKAGQKIIVIQQAEYYDKSELVTLHNIYLAYLRAEALITDIDSLTMKLPVESGYFVWREFMRDGLLASGGRILHSDWLTTGPLFNQYCEYGAVRKDGDGILSVPNHAVCAVELLPVNDHQAFFEDHSIDADKVSLLHREWILAKKK